MSVEGVPNPPLNGFNVHDGKIVENCGSEPALMSPTMLERRDPWPLATQEVLRKSKLNNTIDASEGEGQNTEPLRKAQKADSYTLRDQEAIQYSQNLLNEGDTLVYIVYPCKAYNSTGFCISDRIHRVHSHKLLATGSTKFKELLSPTKQFRTVRKKHINLASRLPSGIKFVLDLTPPDEGDDAVELLASLSCSYGIQQWYSSEQRLKVNPGLVGGLDEAAATTCADPVATTHLRSVASHPVADDSVGTNDSVASTEIHATSYDPAMAQAVEDSMADVVILPKNRTKWKYREVPEYDAIRHRSAIVRLLQHIEGKRPKLDSAPKMWSLLAVAAFFDCVEVVRDEIVSWLVADPNTRFLEILPEAACKIGLQLESPIITRAAFAVLVGDEALSLVSRSRGKHIAEQNRRNVFGRRIEEYDEDLKTRIEYASRSFIESINGIFDDFLNVTCEEFHRSEQWQRIKKLEDAVKACQHIHGKDAFIHLSLVKHLRDCLRNWVKGHILKVLLAPLSHELCQAADANRLAEDYGSFPTVKPMSAIYSAMSYQERLFTSLFWRMLRSRLTKHNNALVQQGSDSGRFDLDTVERALAHTYGIGNVHLDDINSAAMRLNSVVSTMYSDACHQSGDVSKPSEGAHVSWDAEPTRSDGQDASRLSVTTLPFHKLNRSDGLIDACTSNHENNALDADMIDANNDFDTLLIQSVEDKRRTLMNSIGSVPIGRTRHRMGSKALDKFETRSSATGERHEHHFDAWKDSEDVFEHNGAFDEEDHEDTMRDIRRHQNDDVLRHMKRRTNVADTADSLRFFSPGEFFQEAAKEIAKTCEKVLSIGDINEIQLTDTLVCLGPREFKYLPLWAGGDDDGSGGVFNEDLPIAIAGPAGPGPAYHTGFSAASISSGRSIDDNAMSWTTSTNTSQMVEDGRSDALPRGKVVSDDGIASEAFSDCSSEWAAIRRIGHSTHDTHHDTCHDETSSLDDAVMSYDGSDTGTELGFEIVGVEEAERLAGMGHATEKKHDLCTVEDEGSFLDESDDEAFDYGDESLSTMVTN